jgi:hypothetical protein
MHAQPSSNLLEVEAGVVIVGVHIVTLHCFEPVVHRIIVPGLSAQTLKA